MEFSLLEQLLVVYSLPRQQLHLDDFALFKSHHVFAYLELVNGRVNKHSHVPRLSLHYGVGCWNDGLWHSSLPSWALATQKPWISCRPSRFRTRLRILSVGFHWVWLLLRSEIIVPMAVPFCASACANDNSPLWNLFPPGKSSLAYALSYSPFSEEITDELSVEQRS